MLASRPGSPRLGGYGLHHCGAGCRAAGSASARFQTLLVYARKRDCLAAYYEGMLERWALLLWPTMPVPSPQCKCVKTPHRLIVAE